jgi:hypothetical protein
MAEGALRWNIGRVIWPFIGQLYCGWAEQDTTALQQTVLVDASLGHDRCHPADEQLAPLRPDREADPVD